MKSQYKNAEILNRKARHEYSFVQNFNAGIVLAGTEVKSLREGKANLADAYCLFTGTELWIKNLYISEYSFGTYANHNSRKDRKLLLKKAELAKILRRVTEKGMTVIPYRLFFSDRGFVKIEIALAQGKKEFDKRETIKDRENKRELDRIKKIKL
ncbi:MAG: SsrA-binding protein SmpB [Saprospiraceae bacterium]